jgi:hypothetical protein
MVILFSYLFPTWPLSNYFGNSYSYEVHGFLSLVKGRRAAVHFLALSPDAAAEDFKYPVFILLDSIK